MPSNYLIDNKIIYDKYKRELSKIDEPKKSIKISKPGAQCLQILIEANHTVVSQNNICEYIWGGKGIIVGANTLHQHIYMLRKSFSTLGVDKGIIKTVPRLGINIPESFTISPIDTKTEFNKCDNAQQSFPYELTPMHEKVTSHKINKKVNHGNIILAILSILSIATTIILTHFYQELLNNEYSYLGQYHSCMIYRDSEEFKLPYITSRIIKHEINCDYNEKHFLYFSENKKSRMESIILCESRIGGNLKGNCKSFHWSGYE